MATHQWADRASPTGYSTPHAATRPWPTSPYVRTLIVEALQRPLPRLRAAVLRPVVRRGEAAYAAAPDWPHWEIAPNKLIVASRTAATRVVLQRRLRIAVRRHAVCQGVGWGLGLLAALNAALVRLDADEERGGTWCEKTRPRHKFVSVPHTPLVWPLSSP